MKGHKIFHLSGNSITNGREPRSCLDRVFGFKSGNFTDNTKIAQPANATFKVENSVQVLTFQLKFIHVYGWEVMHLCVCLCDKTYTYLIFLQWNLWLKCLSTKRFKNQKKTQALSSKPEASFLNKSSRLVAALDATKFIAIIAMNSVTLCCAS